MKEIITRTANLSDLPILLDFEQGIIEAERPLDVTLKSGKISYYDFRQMILEPETEVAIAVINSEIIGSGYAKIIEAKPYYTFKEYASLGFMYTNPDFRGLSVNSKIIDFLKNWCISKNIKEMRLDVYNTNIAAIKSYEKNGFKKDMVNMRLSL